MTEDGGRKSYVKAVFPNPKPAPTQLVKMNRSLTDLDDKLVCSFESGVLEQENTKTCDPQ